MQILFGLLRFGKFIELVPVPVVSGFMSGVGIIILLLQLPPLLGSPVQADPMASAGMLPAAWQQLNAEALVLALLSLGLVYLLPRRVAQLIPSPLVGDHQVLVLDLSDVPLIDYTATRSLQDMVIHAREAGRKVILVGGGHPNVMKMIANLGVVAEAAKTCDASLQASRLDGLRRAARLLG